MQDYYENDNSNYFIEFSTFVSHDSYRKNRRLLNGFFQSVLISFDFTVMMHTDSASQYRYGGLQ